MNALRLLRSLRVLATLLLAAGALSHAAAAEEASAQFAAIPDVEVQDQSGRTVRFRTDLLQGGIVAVNFVFTSCTTVCPQLATSSAALARELAAGADPRLRVISISVDAGDTPERLKQWAANFGAAPGWTLVTGRRRAIDELLRAFEVYAPDRTLHTSNFLVGKVDRGHWRRVAAETSPTRLATLMRELAPSASTDASAADASAAARYFPDVALINQDGKPVHFYRDLVRGRVVVISSMFTDCGGACPIMAERIAKVQAALGDRVGRDVHLISISVDPENDTPEKLRAYADRVGAKPGWQFLTGDKSAVDLVLKKLGQYADTREGHSNIVIIGNEPTGLWKKAFGLAAPEEIVRIAESVANDRSPTPGT